MELEWESGKSTTVETHGFPSFNRCDDPGLDRKDSGSRVRVNWDLKTSDTQKGKMVEMTLRLCR